MTPEEVAQALMNTAPSEIPIGVFVQAAELIQSREQAVAEERERCARQRFQQSPSAVRGGGISVDVNELRKCVEILWAIQTGLAGSVTLDEATSLYDQLGVEVPKVSKAADELEALRKENDKLKKRWSSHCCGCAMMEDSYSCDACRPE